MDNEEVKGENMRVLMGKDVENTSNYSKDEHNFVAPGELTVTITLSEYRSLIKTAEDAHHFSLENYDLRRAKENLQEQLDACKKELTECKTKLESFQQMPEESTMTPEVSMMTPEESMMTPEESMEESMMPGEPTGELVFVEDADEN